MNAGDIVELIENQTVPVNVGREQVTLAVGTQFTVTRLPEGDDRVRVRAADSNIYYLETAKLVVVKRAEVKKKRA